MTAITETDKKPLAYYNYHPPDFDSATLVEFKGVYAAHFERCNGTTTLSATTPEDVWAQARTAADKHADDHRKGMVRDFKKPHWPPVYVPCQPALSKIFEVWSTTIPSRPTSWQPIRPT